MHTTFPMCELLFVVLYTGTGVTCTSFLVGRVSGGCRGSFPRMKVFSIFFKVFAALFKFLGQLFYLVGVSPLGEEASNMVWPLVSFSPSGLGFSLFLWYCRIPFPIGNWFPFSSFWIVAWSGSCVFMCVKCFLLAFFGISIRVFLICVYKIIASSASYLHSNPRRKGSATFSSRNFFTPIYDILISLCFFPFLHRLFVVLTIVLLCYIVDFLF